MIELIETRQIAQVEALMAQALGRRQKRRICSALPVRRRPRRAVFLGSIGDPNAHDSSKQALRVAGLTLVEFVQRGKPIQK